MNQRTLHTVEDIKRDLERQGKSIAENPDCEHCPLNTTSSNISEQR